MQCIICIAYHNIEHTNIRRSNLHLARALLPIHFSQIDRARTDTGSGLRYKERSKVIWIHPKVKIQKECKEDFSPF